MNCSRDCLNCEYADCIKSENFNYVKSMNNKRYYERHKEKENARSREYRKTHREQINARKRATYDPAKRRKWYLNEKRRALGL